MNGHAYLQRRGKEPAAISSAPSSLSKYLPQNPMVRYGIGIALVAAALGLSLVFESSFRDPFFGFFFPASVIATTWFCGEFPGWLATALSMVVVQYYFFCGEGDYVVLNNPRSHICV